jgi:soluble lytic murein transglycosylase
VSIRNRFFRFAVVLSLIGALLTVVSALAETTQSAKSKPNRKTTASRLRSPNSAKKKAAPKLKTRGSAKARAASKRRKAADLRRLRRMNRAFVASATLKPMARQLLQSRTRAAYAGVQAYARRHAGTDAGAMANLVLGYAHILDHDYAQAIPPLKNSHGHAGELGDYVDYFLAMAYGGTAQQDQVISILQTFDTEHGDSVFVRDAAVIYANALVAANRPQEAIAELQKFRVPERSDVDLALARAYLKASDSARASELLRRIYFTMPLASEANDAKADLDSLTTAGVIPPASFADGKERADTLARAQHWSDAVREYRALLDDAAPSDRPVIQAALGMALHHAGNDREARDLLESIPETPEEHNAQRLLALAEIARSANDENAFNDALAKLRQNHTASPYFEDALLLGGNMYLLKPDYDRAIDYYRELQQRFPTEKLASYAHWKTAWLSFRQNRIEEAKKLFEEQIDWYPASPQVPAALYWRARLAEQDGDLAKAHAWYAKLADSFRNYYYADLARSRMGALLVPASSTTPDPLLKKVEAPQVPVTFADSGAPPADDLRAEKARLLENAGMTSFSVKELRAAASDGGAGWATREIARMYQDDGRYDQAIEALKRAVPSYYALDLPALPRDAWQVLFPRPYWTDLRRYSRANGLDPFLVASLVRQESEFNPGAVSNANALGLMQLLPGTARVLARGMHLRRFRTENLLSPTTNLQLGTRYFRDLMDHYNGRLEYALAAYNAGSDRVDSWLATGNFRDPQEFVESIPFTETREYVQAILRNSSVYRRLYGTP